ncbi:MAG: 4Fe-4S dicluster domain-containing protein [Magnetospirillum sp.]|nr:4Fe-4S dicluster domain-containing protein [Magnetospirillum sp.]
MNRRAVVHGLLAGAALTLAPGVTLLRAAPVAAPGRRWGLLIDAGRCREGCDACVDACQAEHGWGGHGLGAADPHWIRKVEFSGGGAARSAPVMCQHCGDAPCVQVCPTTASFQRADGIVLVDRHRCIGCRYCIMACPIKARSFVHDTITGQHGHAPRGKGTAEGCTLCAHRVDAGRLPACVEACAGQAGAMLFGDLNDPASEIAQAVRRHAATRLRPDLGLDAGVAYLDL